MRREAFKLVNSGTMSMSLAEALEAVVKDADLKETFFTTPLAMYTAGGGPKSLKPNWKGEKGDKGHKGKGKNDKGGKKGGGKSESFNVGTSLLPRHPTGESCALHTMHRAAGVRVEEATHAE